MPVKFSAYNGWLKAGPNAKAGLNNLVEQVDIGFFWSVIFNIIIICSIIHWKA